MRSRSLSLIFGSYTSAVGWESSFIEAACIHIHILLSILFDRVGRCHSSSRCSPVSPLVTGHRCVSPLSSHEAAQHRTLVTTTVPAHTLTLCRYVPCLYSGLCLLRSAASYRSLYSYTPNIHLILQPGENQHATVT